MFGWVNFFDVTRFSTSECFVSWKRGELCPAHRGSAKNEVSYRLPLRLKAPRTLGSTRPCFGE